MGGFRLVSLEQPRKCCYYWPPRPAADRRATRGDSRPRRLVDDGVVLDGRHPLGKPAGGDGPRGSSRWCRSCNCKFVLRHCGCSQKWVGTTLKISLDIPIRPPSTRPPKSTIKRDWHNLPKCPTNIPPRTLGKEQPAGWFQHQRAVPAGSQAPKKKQRRTHTHTHTHTHTKKSDTKAGARPSGDPQQPQCPPSPSCSCRLTVPTQPPPPPRAVLEGSLQ